MGVDAMVMVAGAQFCWDKPTDRGTVPSCANSSFKFVQKPVVLMLGWVVESRPAKHAGPFPSEFVP